MSHFVTVKKPLSALGRESIALVQNLGRAFLFFLRGFVLIFQVPFQIRKIEQQIYFIGMKSVFVICLTGAFTGMVLGVQGYYALVKYGSTGALGSAVAGADGDYGHRPGRIGYGRGNRNYADFRADRCPRNHGYRSHPVSDQPTDCSGDIVFSSTDSPF